VEPDPITTATTSEVPVDPITAECADDTITRRAVGVGASRGDDPRLAGEDATRLALGGLHDLASARLLVVFCSSQLDAAGVARGVSDAAGDVPTIGCTTAGEILSAGPGESGVVVLALGGVGFAVATATEPIRGGDLRAAAERAARCVDEVEDRGNTVLMVLSDGLAGDQQEVVRGAYARVGAEIPLVGGCAGDDLRMERTTLLHGADTMSNAIVMAAISSDAPLGIGVSHGWRAVGEPMMVTRSEGVVVRTLDDRAALSAYLDQFDAPEEVRRDPEAFTAFAATRPLGVTRRGRDEIRGVATADFGAEALECFAEVPQGASCRVMSGDVGSVLAATDQACGAALDALHGRAAKGLVVFDCAARKGLLGGGGTSEEIARVGSMSGSARVAGFYTYGEFARTSGPGGFHNQAIVVLALA
jgi:hypothetical protein